MSGPKEEWDDLNHEEKLGVIDVLNIDKYPKAELGILGALMEKYSQEAVKDPSFQSDSFKIARINLENYMLNPKWRKTIHSNPLYSQVLAIKRPNIQEPAETSKRPGSSKTSFISLDDYIERGGTKKDWLAIMTENMEEKNMTTDDLASLIKEETEKYINEMKGIYDLPGEEEESELSQLDKDGDNILSDPELYMALLDGLDGQEKLEMIALMMDWLKESHPDLEKDYEIAKKIGHLEEARYEDEDAALFRHRERQRGGYYKKTPFGPEWTGSLKKKYRPPIPEGETFKITIHELKNLEIEIPENVGAVAVIKSPRRIAGQLERKSKFIIDNPIIDKNIVISYNGPVSGFFFERHPLKENWHEFHKKQKKILDLYKLRTDPNLFFETLVEFIESIYSA